MRICGTFCRLEQLRGPKEGSQPHRVTRQRVRSALLAIDHADGRSARQTGRAEGLDGLDRGPSRGDHVLDQAHSLARLEGALQPVFGAVSLGLLAHDQERQPRGERGRRGERNRAELGAGEPDGIRLVSLDRLGDQLAERAASRSGRVSKRYLSR